MLDRIEKFFAPDLVLRRPRKLLVFVPDSVANYGLVKQLCQEAGLGSRGSVPEAGLDAFMQAAGRHELCLGIIDERE